MKWVGLLFVLQMTGVFAFQTDVVLPWVTHNEQFTSQVGFENPQNLGVRVTVTLSGRDIENPQTTVLLNPFEQRHLTVEQMFPALPAGTGFNLRITSEAEDIRAGLVLHATTTESRMSPAQVHALPAEAATNMIVFSNLVQNESDFSSPVVMNMGDSETEVTFYPYRWGRTGAPVTRTLGPKSSLAETMVDLFPEQPGVYYVIASADQPLLGTSFFFNSQREPSMSAARAIDGLPRINSGTTVATLAQDVGFVDAVTTDAEGNVYVSDFFGGGNFNDIRGTNILKMAPDGTVSVHATGFDGPLGQAWDAAGNLYVANWNTGEVRRATPDGQVTVFAEGFNGPSGLAFDSNGNLYVANYLDGRTIHRVAPDGTVGIFVQSDELNGPVGIVFDDRGELYVANYNDGKIFAIEDEGEMRLITQLRGPDFFTIGYMTFAKGNLYVTAIGENKIYQISRDGEIRAFAGTGEFNVVDGAGEEALFAQPNGITASADGNTLFITSFAGRMIRSLTVPD
ncbi:virginiamycin B lyase family protein [Acanthopleuribacter pedis]|uniref:SMP-30/Gluconolactonase/LRE-like region domain-containing protein n=1 Tax=Acanthopleuribacter pedis TaxID=442870 RepID=A0A8J7PZB5_9BACT|nr:hypothetical protein [Acanthopleuribacter pedis]MBO1317482.1 hypothetical protein [Acanthopleuribacter pedis]